MLNISAPMASMSQSSNDSGSVFPRRDIDPALVVGFGERAPTAVLIFGTEHSGAALCSKVLHMLGVQTVAEQDRDNGDNGDNQPGPTTAELHEFVLGLFNRRANQPFADLLLPVAWWNDPRVAAVKHNLAKIVEASMARGGAFAIVDPEITRVLPIWLQLMDEMQLERKFVLCLRNPADMSRGPQQDGVDPELSEYRWFNHMIELFRNLQHRDLCVIEYETWFSRPEVNFKKLIEHLGLPWYQSEADLRLIVAEHLASQRHPDTEIGCRHPLVRSLYKLVQSLCEDPTAGDRIGSIVGDFVVYQQLQRPLLREFGEAAAALPQLEQDLSRCAGLIDELRTRIDGLMAEREAFRSAPVAIQATEGRGTENRSHEVDQRELYAEISARDAALAEARQRIERMAAERDAALAERSVAQFAIERLRRGAPQEKPSAEASAQEPTEVRDGQPAADGPLAHTQQALQQAAAEKARQRLDAMRARFGISASAEPEAASPTRRAP